MSRLHEFQGKSLLKEFNISIPRGGVARKSEEVYRLASEIGGEVVIKAQAWTTGRASVGGIRFVKTPVEASEAAEEILGMSINNFIVDAVLIEEKLKIKREFYAGLIIDDQLKAPVMIFSSIGGTGIEEIAFSNPDAVNRIKINILRGLQDFEARNLIRITKIHGRLQLALGGLLVSLYQVARKYEARSAEINPIVLTEDGKLYAADCRITIDDYAAPRHPELGIEIAREFDRPPTELEMIAWGVEKNDYRGTFYFIQMEQDFKKGDRVIGFHGAGGGGSMMSMDAILHRGYKIANFVDTSGNPPASKVYRAARIILAQKGLDGYFGSGSGVASQEQFHSARGLVKAFLEEPLSIPAVIRLGGNSEDQAIAILERARSILPVPIEGYGKDDTPEFCAERLDFLIQNQPKSTPIPEKFCRPEVLEPYSFETVTGGTVIFDHNLCRQCESNACISSCVPGILSLSPNPDKPEPKRVQSSKFLYKKQRVHWSGPNNETIVGESVPVLNISHEDAKKGRCIECLACDIECYFEGNKGGRLVLPISGLDDYIRV